MWLTSHRAPHWNSLDTHTNEYNYRYHKHRPRRLSITLENSGKPEERNPGVCNPFCHVCSVGLSSFMGGMQCSFSGSPLSGTYMNAVISVREGERRTTSGFPPGQSKQTTRDLSLRHNPILATIPRERKSTGIGRQRSWA